MLKLDQKKVRLIIKCNILHIALLTITSFMCKGFLVIPGGQFKPLITGMLHKYDESLAFVFNTFLFFSRGISASLKTCSFKQILFGKTTLFIHIYLYLLKIWKYNSFPIKHPNKFVLSIKCYRYCNCPQYLAGLMQDNI